MTNVIVVPYHNPTTLKFDLYVCMCSLKGIGTFCKLRKFQQNLNIEYIKKDLLITLSSVAFIIDAPL